MAIPAVGKLQSAFAFYGQLINQFCCRATGTQTLLAVLFTKCLSMLHSHQPQETYVAVTGDGNIYICEWQPIFFKKQNLLGLFLHSGCLSCGLFVLLDT